MVGYSVFNPEPVTEESPETVIEEWDWFFGVCGGMGHAGKQSAEKVFGGYPADAQHPGAAMEAPPGNLMEWRKPISSMGGPWGSVDGGSEDECSLSLPDLLPSGVVEECMPDCWDACKDNGKPSQSQHPQPELPILDSVWGSSPKLIKAAELHPCAWTPKAAQQSMDHLEASLQLPSLRSVFGTCAGSNDGLSMDLDDHGLPSLHSIFGTCGGMEQEQHMMPGCTISIQLPSLKSVFGSCEGLDGELAELPESSDDSEDVSFEALGFEEILPSSGEGSLSKDCGVRLDNYTPLQQDGASHLLQTEQPCEDNQEMPVLDLAEKVTISKMQNGIVLSGKCLPTPFLGTKPGTDAVASPAAMSLVVRQGGREGLKPGGSKKELVLAEGCTRRLKDQCQDPLFDAEWNVIGMINSLMADPLAVAVEALDGAGQRQSCHVFYEVLEHVIAVPRQHIFEMRRLGEGAYGFVSLSCCPGLGEVAVKWFKSEDQSSRWPEFQHECALLAELPRHRNLLEFMGLVKQSSESNEIVGYISEFCDLGTLSRYSRRKGVALNLEERVTMALQIARGMAVLHQNNICHFDLKPDNILLVTNSSGRHPCVRIGDFGLARHLVAGYIKSPSSLRGTLPYVSPEMVSSTPLVDAKVDVWAFGAVLCEMASLEMPYRGLSSEEILLGLMEGNLRPVLPEWVEPEYRHLVDSCLEYAADDRPSFHHIIEYLEGVCMERGWCCE